MCAHACTRVRESRLRDGVTSTWQDMHAYMHACHVCVCASVYIYVHMTTGRGDEHAGGEGGGGAARRRPRAGTAHQQAAPPKGASCVCAWLRMCVCVCVCVCACIITWAADGHGARATDECVLPGSRGEEPESQGRSQASITQPHRRQSLRRAARRAQHRYCSVSHATIHPPFCFSKT